MLDPARSYEGLWNKAVSGHDPGEIGIYTIRSTMVFRHILGKVPKVYKRKIEPARTIGEAG